MTFLVVVVNKSVSRLRIIVATQNLRLPFQSFSNWWLSSPCTCCILYSSRSNNVVFHSWHLIINGIIQNQNDFFEFHQFLISAITINWYLYCPLILYVDSIISNIIGVNVIEKLIYSSSATTFLFFFHIIIAVIEILAWDLLLFV